MYIMYSTPIFSFSVLFGLRSCRSLVNVSTSRAHHSSLPHLMMRTIVSSSLGGNPAMRHSQCRLSGVCRVSTGTCRTHNLLSEGSPLSLHHLHTCYQHDANQISVQISAQTWAQGLKNNSGPGYLKSGPGQSGRSGTTLPGAGLPSPK